MAAKHAACADTRANASGVTEKTGRFDRIHIDRVFVEVNLPGYNLAKAIEKSQRRWAKKRPATPAPASAEAQQPVVFGEGSAPAEPPIQQPQGPPAADIQIDL
jgi:hypothetical protein